MADATIIAIAFVAWVYSIAAGQWMWLLPAGLIFLGCVGTSAFLKFRKEQT